MPFYLKYNNEQVIGPIAPDNPKCSWDDPRVMFACKKFAKEMEKSYGVEYVVVTSNSLETSAEQE